MGRFTAKEVRANPVPSLKIRKKAGKMEKRATGKKFDRFQSRHFFPLRVNFRFFEDLAWRKEGFSGSGIDEVGRGEES
jgi:hypothetical protein